jgi:ribose transport system permease protein
VPAVLLALLLAVVIGLLQGALIARLGVAPFVITLGSMLFLRGVAEVLTQGSEIGFQGKFPGLRFLGEGNGLGLPMPFWFALVAVLAIAFIMHRTIFGRYCYAIGSNAEAARRAGINVDRHLIKVYALSGFLAGLAGLVSLARFATTTIGGHSTDNLAAIAAVVLGGTSLFGGIGTVLGTVVGVFIPAVLQNGFVILGVQPFWQQVAVGAVLIVAVYIDQLKRRAQERGGRR